MIYVLHTMMVPNLLKNINIEIKKGEKVAIIGPNGAGKSTFFSHFNGLNKPTSGCVKINGNAISFEKEDLYLKLDKKLELYFKIQMISYLHQLLEKM